MTGSRTNIATGPAGRPWRFDLVLDDGASVPRQTQLSRAIVQEIQRGRLLPGSTLPGSRTLAAQLNVNRKVVVAAVDELVAQGWLEALPARGTRVALNLPTLAVADAEGRRSVDTVLAQRRATMIAVNDGIPDARIAPVDELARAQRRALRALARTGLGYGDAAGDPVLREVLAGFVNHARGLSCSSEEVVLTRGSQGALSLFALAMLEPGDVIAVEHPGYTPAWRAFQLARADVVHVPVDAHGLRTEELEAHARRLKGRLKAVYVTPHHQYPTTVAMSAERRMHLRRICESFRLYIVEDDYDYEYHFEGAPLLPLAATKDLSSRCIYVASLSKLIAPALRLGYIIADRSVVARLRAVRELLDRQGDVALERAVAELIEDGEIQRHARRARQLYRQRRDHLLEQLASRPPLRSAIECDPPGGGLALWMRLRNLTSEELVQRAHARGLALTPGSVHVAAGAVPAFRFGFAAHTSEELSRICDTLEACLASDAGSRRR
ncbi:PLP-dependent aminotransferase family protein [Sorangium sp. So ce726]|uniref:MocR-like pyridoxine biosynthesis transcription factor PdxR n=1 Tax=Sorangium sp. So ce726 TaxID=3133319 RepID=UPI003F5EDD50